MLELLPKTLIGIAGAVFLFGFAIFVHELGHFLTAKWFGVGVKKFAIGFGPIIWAFVWRGTEYSLRWIPVGGFVSLKGMIEGLDEAGTAPVGATPDGKPKEAKADDSSPGLEKELAQARKAAGGMVTEDLDALRNRNPLVRIAVFAAGVTCNFLTALVLVGIVFWRGVPVEKPLANSVYEVPTNSPLYGLGWRSGDRIVEAAGKPVGTWDDVASATVSALKGEKLAATVRFGVEREGRRIDVVLPAGMSAKDLSDFRPSLPAIVGAAIPRSGAATARLVKDDYVPGETIRPLSTWEEMRKMPLHEGDRIVAIEDKPIACWQEMDKEIRARPGQAILLTVERPLGGQKRLMRLIAVLEVTDEQPPAGRLGIIMGGELTGERERESFLRAFAMAPTRTVTVGVRLVSSTVLFIREVGWGETKRSLGGPLKIGQIAYQKARRGLDDYLDLFVKISLMLAIMNLLPIPVLDGGYILITIIETIIRRPIPERILVPVLTSFMLFFITAIGWLFINDIFNW